MVHSKLTENHRRFLIGFKEGKPDWSLLPFEGIEELPSVKWKMINLARMEERKRQEAIDKLKEVLKL